MEDEPSNNRLRPLIGLAIMVVAFAGIWFVVDQLRRSAALQDCYASGRRDCVTIDSTGLHNNR